jgi:predicted Rossmann fold flavoprotein
MKKVIVIGGGPAGLFAGIWAAKNGASVTILEKKERPARKLMITGKGRCNLTNNADVSELIENVPGNGVFLYSAFYSFTNEQLVEFFNKIGVKTKLERGGRIFPESDKAVEIVDALVSEAKRNNVEIMCFSEVDQIIAEDQRVKGIKLKDKREFLCDAVILATGGMSYPLTGSTGDGYKMAQKLGHTIVPSKPSLVPLETKEKWVKDVMGLSLKNVGIRINHKGKKVLYEDFGEMLFTHFGVSGPMIISSSRHLLDVFYDGDKKKDVGDDVTLLIDLKPALSIEKLDDRVQRDFIKHTNKQFKNSLIDLLPSKLIPAVIKLTGIDEDKMANQITRAERMRLVEVLKNLPLTIKGFRPIEEAIVTAGGVNIDEINPSTMESKIIKGLFFAGEIIDVDAYTGGFNLQIAFSTGYVAGVNT